MSPGTCAWHGVPGNKMLYLVRGRVYVPGILFCLVTVPDMMYRVILDKKWCETVNNTSFSGDGMHHRGF